MSELIQSLKEDHVRIAEALSKIGELGFTTKEGQAMLIKAKGGLLEHLKKEDEKLYPVLRKAAETNRELKQMLDSFSKDMEDVTKVAIDFFTKYEGGGAGMDFARDYGKLVGVLKARIKKEESVLYVEFNKLAVTA